MNDRTVAFILGGATVLAWVIFWNGIVRGHISTHPDSLTSNAILKLT